MRAKLATLQTLVDRRLLRRDRSADGNYYELSHDSLVTVAAAPCPRANRAVSHLLDAGGLVALLSDRARMTDAFIAAVMGLLLWLFGRCVPGVFRESRANLNRSAFRDGSTSGYPAVQSSRVSSHRTAPPRRCTSSNMWRVPPGPSLPPPSHRQMNVKRSAPIASASSSIQRLQRS
jgi:hypothetical protein